MFHTHSTLTIEPCSPADFETILGVINDAAQAYRGVIPGDCWHDPYMSSDYLHREIDRGVAFSCAKRGVRLLGVMGIQQVRDVTLIRHAYVLTESRRNGIGGELLSCLTKQATNPVLIGTWKVATWAVAFYRKHGFTPVDEETKTRLLRKYWVIPDRQIETSVVLADETWIAGSSAGG